MGEMGQGEAGILTRQHKDSEKTSRMMDMGEKREFNTILNVTGEKPAISILHCLFHMLCANTAAKLTN
jgi:hypothetical protein